MGEPGPGIGGAHYNRLTMEFMREHLTPGVTASSAGSAASTGSP